MTDTRPLMTDDISLHTYDRNALPWRTCIALALLVLVAAGPFVHPLGEQQASRYALTAAIWDDQTFVLDGYAEILGRDYALKDGTIYSDKAPGQPVLAVPFLGLYRLVDPDDPLPQPNSAETVIWWLTFWTATVPAAALAVMMYLWAREVAPDRALVSALTMSFGTLLFVYSTLLFAHVLAATLAFAMFLLVRRRGSPLGRLYLAGLLGGLAVVVEFPVALVVAILTAAAFWTHRVAAWRVLAGGLPAVILLALYNRAVFGSLTSLSYQFSGFLEEPRSPTEIFPGPSWQLFLEVLYSPRGLLVAAPVLIMAIFGLFRMKRVGYGFDAVVAGLAFVAMLLVQMSWSSPYAGGAGPRYVTPGLPFLAAPLAVAWVRWRLSTIVLAVLSVMTLGLATLTDPQLSSTYQAGLGHWVGEFFSGAVAPIIWTEAIGPVGWLVYVATVGLAGYVLWKANQRDQIFEASEPTVLPPSHLTGVV